MSIVKQMIPTKFEQTIPFDMSLLNKVKPFINNPATDIVKIDHKTDMGLFQTFVNENVNTITLTPSDIFFANTIPLKDIEIEVDERNEVFSYGKGMIIRYRMIVFDDLQDLYNKEKAEIGYLVVYVPNSKSVMCAFSLSVEKGNDYIIPTSAYTVVNVPCTVNIFTNTWYAIQIALLHPQIKTLFDKPARVPVHNKGNYKCNKRKIKYIRVHNLRIDDVKNITHEPGTINRKCLVWYVIGHWRQYKSGKRVFIQGYWKGQLRDIKRNLDERERVIDQIDLSTEGDRK